MGIPDHVTQRLARQISISLLAGFCAAGCASKAAPNTAAREPESPIAGPAPLATDGEPQKQQVVVDSVNDTVDRFDQIIKQREQAKRNAVDLRETREAAGQATAKAAAPDDAATIEKLAAKLRQHQAIDPIPDPTQSAGAPKPTAPNTPTDAGTAVASSANRAVDASADQTAAAPAEASSADASGAITAAPSVEVNRNGSPTISRSSSADPMLAVQQKLITRVTDDPRDLSAQLDLQLLRFLHNEPVPTMSDLSALPAEDRELLAAMCDALSNFRSVVQADANPLNSAKARPFIDMADRIRARADLTLSGLTLCRKVMGFGVYDKIDPLSFDADGLKKFVLYCEVDGFLSQLNAGQKWETKLSLELKLYDEHNLLIWQLPATPTSDLSARRRRDFFLVQMVELPVKMAAGHYLLKARVRDLVGSRVAEQTIQFEVRAPEGANAPTADASDLPHIPKESVKR